MDHTHRFDGKSEIYEKIRPQHADGLFVCFRDTLKIPADSVFADVGAGTGIFTRQLLSCAIRSLRQSRTATCAKRRKKPFVTTRGFAPSAARSIRPFTAILAASATKNVGRFRRRMHGLSRRQPPGLHRPRAVLVLLSERGRRTLCGICAGTRGDFSIAMRSQGTSPCRRTRSRISERSEQKKAPSTD